MALPVLFLFLPYYLFNLPFISLSKILSSWRFQIDLSATYSINSKKDSKIKPIRLSIKFIAKLPDLSTTLDRFLEMNLQLNKPLCRLSRMNKGWYQTSHMKEGQIN